MKNKIFALIFVCLTFFTIPVLAEEKIESFDSLIQVQTDGSMLVTETLTVHHEGINIRRGIYRDLPTKKGEKYELIGVTRNGHYEPSFVERRSGYYRINTGDDSFLPRPATSIFEIKYRVWNIPKSFKGYDEVYWNVTGDEWSFPIESVSAKIELPYGADIIQQASYIGRAGSKESATNEENGQFRGRYLHPREQLTIAVGFTPGIVSTEKHISWWDVIRNIIPFVLYFIYLGFLIWAWHKKGRDPVERAIMPQYEAPKELTAAQAHCLYHKGGTKNLVAISLIQMITNGFLKLTIKKRSFSIFSHDIYILEKTNKQERNVEEESFRSKKITLDGTFHENVSSLSRRLQKKVEKSMQPFYSKNHAWVLWPTFLLLFSLFLMWGIEILLQAGVPIFLIPVYSFQGIFILMFSILFTFLGCFIFKTLFRQILYTMIYISFLFFIWRVADLSDVYQPLSVLLVISTCSIFSYLMYRPTEKGQRLLEHLEGLKIFLKSTKDPVRAKTKPTEKCMEKLFPYAMVLGLEKEWERKFKNLFGPDEYGRFVFSHPYTSHSFAHSFSSSTFSSGGSGGGGGSGGSGSGGGGCSGGGGGGGGGGGR